MRIKVTTGPPLPLLKAWFPVPSAHPETPSEFTVANLKTRLCNTLPLLSTVAASSLRLSIDGFELLDDCDIGVVRDGDLVCIEQVNTSEKVIKPKGNQSERSRSSRKPTPPLRDIHPTSKKRKRSLESTSTSESESTPESDTSSSSSSPSPSSSSSSTTTDSEAASTTSDSSEESESETSEPDSGPSLALTRRTDLQAAKPKLPPCRPSNPPPNSVRGQLTYVPPGFGKPQTRARNKRRRLKRLHDREAVPPASGLLSGPNAIATDLFAHTENHHDGSGRPQESEKSSSENTPDVVFLPSLSLRNKNKAKNFRSLLSKPLPPKIIFAGEEENGISVQIESSTANVHSSSVDPSQLASISMQTKVERQPPATISTPPLVPPSSRPSLPPNLFVTSVDVEAGILRPKKKRKIRAAAEYGSAVAERGYYAPAPAGRDLVEGTGHGEVNVTLDYGDNEADSQQERIPREQSQEETGPLDAGLNGLEQSAISNWTQFPKITREIQVGLKVGDVIAYKDLGINPTTYTPEYLITIARVMSIDPIKEGQIVVRPLQPRTELSFGARLGQDAEEVHEEEFAWDDILNGDWRFIMEC